MYKKVVKKPQVSTPEAPEIDAMEEESSSKEETTLVNKMDDLMTGLESNIQTGPMNLALNNDAGDNTPLIEVQ